MFGPLVSPICFALCVMCVRAQHVNDRPIANAHHMNDRPIFGVVTQPINLTHSSIKWNYVQWLESAGARVAVIPHEASDSDLARLFTSVNGVVLQGGPTSIITSPTKYFQAGKFFVDASVSAAASNTSWFPIQGTCLGFQQLMVRCASSYTLSPREAHKREAIIASSPNCSLRFARIDCSSSCVEIKLCLLPILLTAL